MRYIVLGGGGGFGLHTCRSLLKKSGTESVLAVGRSPPKLDCFRLGVDDDPRFSYAVHHITYDFEKLCIQIEHFNPHVVINFAAQGEGATSFVQSWRYFETNCVGLARLFEWLISTKEQPLFVHIGSSEVYGSTNYPVPEEGPLNPTSPYAVSKSAFDLYLQQAATKFDYPIVILRPSNCYGPGQQLHRLIPKAFLYGMTERRISLHGGGTARKSYMHMDDLFAAIDCAVANGKRGEVYNVGPREPVRIIEIVNRIAGMLGIPMQNLANITPDREHQDSCYWLDTTKAERGLQWRPVVTWEEGLVTVRDWVKNNLNVLKDLPDSFEMKP